LQYRQLGATGPLVSAVGLGCMGFSDGYGVPRHEDRTEAISRLSVGWMLMRPTLQLQVGPGGWGHAVSPDGNL
jgi:hypothetical protein